MCLYLHKTKVEVLFDELISLTCKVRVWMDFLLALTSVIIYHRAKMKLEERTLGRLGEGQVVV